MKATGNCSFFLCPENFAFFISVQETWDITTSQ
ncbi:MAG: hypothetical protein JWQ27_601 [Ferruginibacter sp.]|nr:hypothetical protein [Ferruginibacter sp.]